MPLFSSILRDSRAGGTQSPPARFARFISSLCLCASVLLGAALPGAPVAHADALLLGASTATSTFGQPVLFRAQVSPAPCCGLSLEFRNGATTLATTASSSITGQTIALGWNHICIVDPGGGAQCWGDNSVGELGDGSETDHFNPEYVSGLNSGVIAVGAGALHSCALTNTGGLKCWGDNTWGQLGDGTQNLQTTPVDVIGLGTGVAAMAMGENHTCALTSAGGVKCWGLGTGILGPVDVTGLTSGVTAIAAGNLTRIHRMTL